jgi:hypothetical protein
MGNDVEKERVKDGAWQAWGPYLADRQWGTVREDYSAEGHAWEYFPHDMARKRTYRWGEDGLAGFCDEKARLCLALGLHNGEDPILKERLFGLTNGDGTRRSESPRTRRNTRGSGRRERVRPQ